MVDFYLDEHVATAVAKALRKRDVDVLDPEDMKRRVEFL